MLTSHKAMVGMLTTLSAKVIEDASKVIQASEKTISKTIAKVKKKLS